MEYPNIVVKAFQFFLYFLNFTFLPYPFVCAFITLLTVGIGKRMD